MKISIITPTYNSAKTIKDTIDSILAQFKNNHTLRANLEYIVIDGASTDDTKKIVIDFQKDLNIKLVSEKDNGIFDAMNKGIKMATGDIIGILNSDDFFYSEDTLFKVIKAFESNPNVDAIYGDLVYVDNEDIKKQTRYWKAGEYGEQKLNWGWSIPHPTFFVRREVYEKIQKEDGKIFDTSFNIASDYELTLRLLKVKKIKIKYIPEILVTMRDGGTSASSLRHRVIGWTEQRRVWKTNSLKIPPFFIVRRLLNKIMQYIRLSD